MNDKELINLLLLTYQGNEPNDISWKFSNKSFYVKVAGSRKKFQLGRNELKDAVGDKQGDKIWH